MRLYVPSPAEVEYKSAIYQQSSTSEDRFFFLFYEVGEPCIGRHASTRYDDKRGTLIGFVHLVPSAYGMV